MKILTVIEPWATLLAYGYKKWETRGWATPYRGLVAIHAGKSKECVDDAGLLLLEAGIKKALLDPDPFPLKTWPFGCIVAVGILEACLPTSIADPSPQEQALGDYSAGRTAWVFADVRRVKPLPTRGMQGLKDLPAEVEARLEYLHGV